MIPVRARIIMVALAACATFAYGTYSSRDDSISFGINAFAVALGILIVLVAIEYLEVSLPVGAADVGRAAPDHLDQPAELVALIATRVG